MALCHALTSYRKGMEEPTQPHLEQLTQPQLELSCDLLFFD